VAVDGDDGDDGEVADQPLELTLVIGH